MQYEDRLAISTPEGVQVEVTLAGLGSRLVAAVIDLLVQTAVVVALFIVVWIGGGAMTMPDAGSFGAPDAGTFLVLLAISTIVTFLVLFFYYVFFETIMSGQSPGKRVAKLRVVQTGGQPIGFRASAVRNLLRIIDFLPSTYAVGIISILTTRKNQRLGDLVAGTIVIRDRAPLPEASSRRAVGALGLDANAWDVSDINDEEVGIVRQFLERRETLRGDVRDRIAAELDGRLRPRVPGADVYSSAEDFLQKLVAAKLARD